MILALDDGTAAVIVAVITGLFSLLAALLVQNRKMYREVRQVNRAVNNVPEGTLPLVKRVEALERSAQDLKEHNEVYSSWMAKVLQILADQLGVKLPPYPEDKAA